MGWRRRPATLCCSVTFLPAGAPTSRGFAPAGETAPLGARRGAGPQEARGRGRGRGVAAQAALERPGQARRGLFNVSAGAGI